MTLGSRLALAFALVAALVAATVGALSYQSASLRVMREIDRSLEVAATAVAAGETGVLDRPIVDVWSGPRSRAAPGAADQDQSLVSQLVAPDGAVTPLGGRDVVLPADTARSLAAPTARGQLRVDEVEVGGETYRVLATGLGDARGALQVGVDIDVSRRVLTGLGVEVLATSVAVSLVAAGAGWLLSRRTTRPLAQLADATERVTASGGPDDAGVPETRGRDEVARLATSFRTMLRRLTEARETQERLVQDAAHELRTPLTSLRTNARVLRRLDDLSPESRAKLVADLEGETRELSELVDELVALALTRRTEETEEELDLGELVERVAGRLSRRTGREVVRTVEDRTSVRGRRAALERAVGNLIENAAKFDRDGTEPIRVAVRSGSVAVSDRGPGLPHDAAERIFDRFYRAEEARSLPGSGLGLAIVRDVAQTHDGQVFATDRPNGGSTVGFTVGPARLSPSSHLRHADDSHSPTTLGASSESSGE